MTPDEAVSPPAGLGCRASAPAAKRKKQRSFRRQLRWLMRVTFVATKVTKIACRATPPALRPGALRVSVGPGSAELAMVAALPSLRHAAALVPARPAMLGGGDGGMRARNVQCPSFQHAPNVRRPPHLPRWRRVSQQRTKVSGSACLSDRRERVRNRPFAVRNAGDPAQFAGRLRGMSGFAYFCRLKSRSRKPAQPAAKRPLIWK